MQLILFFLTIDLRLPIQAAGLVLALRDLAMNWQGKQAAKLQ
ncbi:MAG: hypothetical protein NWQ54_11755 [Paraglaciecola sp.]|nr:hypothetical protein [Paraglaciecola sp.]MDP5030543.1 hypothetical protein [Paraglaciecola sp.]MDP5131552.1 hypothetical protein [Paraglaciecola sp.]